MLKVIRQKGVMKTIIWIIAILIIISFGFMGTAYLVKDSSQKKYAGEIFGQKISIEDYQKHFENININALIQYGDKYYDVRQYLNIPGQTWDRLILLHEATKQNIKVTDQDVIDAIQKYPFFRKNDQFDQDLYQKIIANVFKTTTRAFEEGTRNSLYVTKMLADLSKDIPINDNELFDAYKKRMDKIQVSYIALTPTDFKDKISTTDDEITKFYNEKKLDFIQPESVNIEYVQMNFPENATDDTKNAIRQKAENLLTTLSAGNATDVLKANQLSLQTTGFFSKEHPKTDLGWPLDTLNTIFDLTAGEWFGPFENNKSVFITRLKERKDAYMPELAEIKSTVKDAIIKEKGLVLAKNKMAEHLKILKEKSIGTATPDFNALSKELGLEAAQTPMFSRGQYLPKIGVSPDFQEAAFQLSEKNSLSSAVDTEQGSFIIFFNNYTPASQDEFLKVKDQIAKEFLGMKQNEMYSTLLSKLRAQSNIKNYMDKDNE